MPNDIVTRAIDAVCAGDHLTADHASAVLAEIMEGRAERGADRRLPDRAAGEGRDGARAGRPGADDARARRAGRDRAATTSSTPPAPAAGPRPSTSRPPRRWSPPAAGCAVAKHGNRSSTSRCGSADLLEALGVNIELDPEQVGALHRRGRLRLHVRARATTRRWRTSSRSARSSACGRSSTSSAR